MLVGNASNCCKQFGNAAKPVDIINSTKLRLTTVKLRNHGCLVRRRPKADLWLWKINRIIA